MIIEAIKLAAEFNRYFTSANGVDVPAKVSVSRDEWRALFTAIQQAEAQQPVTPKPVGFTYQAEIAYADSTGGNGSFWRVPPDLDDESVPLYTHPAPNVPEFSRIAKFKLDELQKQGFAITGYAIQCGTQRGFITNGGFVGWWRSDEAQSVPDAAIDSAIYNQCPDFDDWHEGPSIDDIRAIVRAAMLAAK